MSDHDKILEADAWLREALGALVDAQSGSEVAVMLAAAGVRGVRCEPERCAVARWMSRRGTPYGRVWVTPYGVSIPSFIEAFVATTPALRQFVQAYDRGAYPELVMQ